ncbi:hypothetical protein MKW94_007412 [Papaver nudicaule]|uniref:C2H2-type domain-containing protein n=1 Tax=Papaver nudicaule TaxID=74823 RepID=A0AA41VLP1_PAPNU|nr:hypothetical protein [Papaver nudicaule]
MEEEHEFKHICKYCKKRFPCGRSLGGHMRSHMNTSTEIEEVIMVGYDQNGGGTTHTAGYGLRENPKKTWRIDSGSRQRDNLCGKCGKGFQSWKAYLTHMESYHSQMDDERSQRLEEFGEEVVEVADDEEDSWSDHENHRKLEESQNLVMDSQSDNEAAAPKRRRSKRTRYKNTNTIITPSTNNNTTSCLTVANSSVSEISNEQEDVAMCLMMLSRDASGYNPSELNCLVESSDNNSLFLEAKSLSLTMRTSENELNNEKKKLKGKKKLGITRFDGKRSELGDCYASGFSRNGTRNGESEVSASFGEEGEFKKPKFDDEFEKSSYTRNRANGKSTRVELGKNLSREVENQSSFKYGKFNSSKRAKMDFYEDELDRDTRKKAKYDGSDSEFCKTSSKKSKYKCTTCNKYFPSYQALGGHRASHKKIKGCSASKVDVSETSIETDLSPDPATDDFKSRNNENVSEFEVTASVETSPGLKKNKHECPICFKVFSSGQALGGHKRSHLVGGSDTRNSPTIVIQQRLPVMRDLLDLNLPAPNDEEANNGDVGYEPWWVGNSHKHEQLVGLISN